jgi:glycosyltransferase involved in cell wall biosynthesis
MDGPRVTVVTPVYNGERHFAECIESVISQTYSNFEYIIVNNCSTDRTLDIAEDYARRDGRIRVMSNPSLLNVVDSHNKAFSVAPAENDYIKIVGADDWLFPNCLAEMVRLAEAHPSVGMVTSYVLVETRIGWDGLPFPSTFLTGRDVCRKDCSTGLRFSVAVRFLVTYERRQEQQPFYTVGNYHGDNEAYLRLLQRHDFGFVHQVLSFNRRGEESRTTHYVQSFNSNILMVLEEIVRFGPVYLSEAELKKRLHEAKTEYYEFLARAVFEFRGKKFWDTHRARLDTLGTPLELGLLSRKTLSRFLDILLNPKRTIENILARMNH